MSLPDELAWKSPVAILLTGPPASGKSVFGRALAANLGAALLDQDVMTGPMTAVLGEILGSGGDLDHPRLRCVSRAATYDALLDTAELNVRTGRTVIMVAPFTAERSGRAVWERIRQRFTAAGADVRLLWMACPEDELLRRMRERGAARDRSKLVDVRAFLESPATRAPVVEHGTVDALGSVPEQLGQARRFLAEKSTVPRAD